ncbi:MAG: peptidase M20 [Myxococcales bacterium]|nr:peptidase M20 [Myxococcales bacterium]
MANRVELSDIQQKELIAFRRRFHTYPELSYEERETARAVYEQLEVLGMEPEMMADTGVVAVLDSGRPGRTVMLRADTDALPVQEENTHAYRSQNDGVMHACGHDGHTAIMLSVARWLKESGALQQGRVLFVFQPAEELAGGAKAMIEAGLFETYKPDCCAGLHLWSLAPTGTILVTDGPFMASADQFEITVNGQGGHGGIPHEAKDPIVAAAQMVVALQSVVSRAMDPADSVVVTIGQISGGEAFNVIPDSVRFSGTVRTFQASAQDAVEDSIRRIVTGIAQAMGLDVDINYTRMTVPTVNDARYAGVVRQVVEESSTMTLGEPGFRTMAGEDMAYFLNECPGIYFFVGAGNEAVGAQYPHHHPCFEIDEAALPFGVELLCEFALRCTLD